jgi:adenine/guanine phosphoribosyltransferase-like PRPP-binding protein
VIINMVDAIKSLRPDNGFVLRGETVQDIDWIDGEPSVPLTQAEVTAEVAAAEAAAVAAAEAAAVAAAEAVAHAKSLGFTDEMIAVMYPGLVEGPPSE